MSSLARPRAVAEPAPPSVRNTVTVLLFAVAAELFESDQVELEVDEGATVGDVERRLRALPAGRRLPAGLRMAVNQRFATPEQPVGPGDEVALIPPVAGG